MVLWGDNRKQKKQCKVNIFVRLNWTELNYMVVLGGMLPSRIDPWIGLIFSQRWHSLLWTETKVWTKPKNELPFCKALLWLGAPGGLIVVFVGSPESDWFTNRSIFGTLRINILAFSRCFTCVCPYTHTHTFFHDFFSLSTVEYSFFGPIWFLPVFTDQFFYNHFTARRVWFEFSRKNRRRFFPFSAWPPSEFLFFSYRLAWM